MCKFIFVNRFSRRNKDSYVLYGYLDTFDMFSLKDPFLYYSTKQCKHFSDCGICFCRQLSKFNVILSISVCLRNTLDVFPVSIFDLPQIYL